MLEVKELQYFVICADVRSFSKAPGCLYDPAQCQQGDQESGKQTGISCI